MCACGSDSASVNVSDSYIPPVITPDPETPETISGGVKRIIYQDGDTVKFFDTSSVYVGYTGVSSYAGSREISVNDRLLYMDSTGNITGQYTLNITPDFCAVDLDGNVWTGEIIDPVTAESLGATPANYFKVYKNNVEYGTWQSRKYLAVNMFLCGTDIIAVNNTGSYHDISGTKTGINSADGFVIYDFNSTDRTAKIDGISVSWTTNYFNNAKSWNGAYSWNGYKWDGATLTENGTVLTAWRNKANYPIILPENAVIISAGNAIFAGETHYFFIECNSGWLFKYIPSSDTLVQMTRLYTGDGYRDTGIYYSKILSPVCSYDSLYFKFDDGGLYRLRFDSMQIGFVDYCDGFLEGY